MNFFNAWGEAKITNYKYPTFKILLCKRAKVRGGTETSAIMSTIKIKLKHFLKKERFVYTSLHSGELSIWKFTRQ